MRLSYDLSSQSGTLWSASGLSSSRLEAYRDALAQKLGEAKPRCYVVVVGLERVLGEEVTSRTESR